MQPAVREQDAQAIFFAVRRELLFSQRFD